MKGHNISLTPYHFSSNNPVMRLDPNGMKDVIFNGVSQPARAVDSVYKWFNYYLATTKL